MSAKRIDQLNGTATGFIPTLMRCFVYFVCVTALGVFGQEALNSPVWYVGLVAILSFAAALYFSRSTRLFQKEPVDVFYYSVGILGVILIFSTESSDRIELAERISLAELEQKSEQATTHLNNFENELPRLALIFEAIQASPDEFLGEVQRIRVENVTYTVAEAQTCWRAITNRDLHWVTPDNRREYSSQDRLRDQLEQAAAIQACAAANERVTAERALIAASTITLESIMENSELTAGLAAYELSLGDRLISLSRSVDALTLFSAPEKIDARRAALTLAESDALEAVKTKRKSLGQAVDDYKADEATLPGLLRYHYWPYVLIVLLSLKLARQRATV